MGQCLLTFQMTVPADELLRRIAKLTQEYQGRLQGDEKSGTFSLNFVLGSIEGDYNVEGEQLLLNITKKPFLLGCDTINATIKEYLRGIAEA
ncbi:MAG: hypothetical protein FJ135_04435 [Deltaproteobacteria bacterium]|nr:hypothetical protein [Deltaproteobacteria bacterium]